MKTNLLNACTALNPTPSINTPSPHYHPSSLLPPPSSISDATAKDQWDTSTFPAKPNSPNTKPPLSIPPPDHENTIGRIARYVMEI
eukprot:scaffold20002_cov76-Cyclotella_meneghiniana.AAC.2